MIFALVYPNWDFSGSVYFGCREPHFPLELAYSGALLEMAGHRAELVDAHSEGLTLFETKKRVEALNPDFIVITTAPGYLFWRCPQPELKVPMLLFREMEGIPAKKVGVGPHCSVTPTAALKKLGADIVVMGEPETVLPELAAKDLAEISSLGYVSSTGLKIQGGQRVTDMPTLPPLKWPSSYIDMHRHHHHRFGVRPAGAGAEVESSRGCPYSCTFCAKKEFRNNYRKRPLPVVLEEIDRLISDGVDYIYFIDEIFMPDRKLLEALASRRLSFGIQTRIDLWKTDMLALLGAAGCVSIEAGVESVTEEGRARLNKRCAVSTGELASLLKKARKSVPFVQATLLDAHEDGPEAVDAWRSYLLDAGIWVNKPVPLFPYPGSEEYSRRWGDPDEYAWERAHEHYLRENHSFSDIQDDRPGPLRELESI